MPPSFSGRAKSLVLKAADTIPAAAWRAMMPRAEIALCYHMISDASLPHVRPLYAYKTPAEFASDLEFLAGSDALVTFDDGFAECRTIVAPLLARHGRRATFFLNTDLIDNQGLMYRHKIALVIDRLERLAAGGGEAAAGAAGEPAAMCRRIAGLLGLPQQADVATLRRAMLGVRADRAALADELCAATAVDVVAWLAAQRPYLTWAQVRELMEEGHTIGAHGCDHRELQALGRTEIERQVVESCNVVRAVTRQERIPFAVPFSLDGLDRSLLADIVRRNPQVGRIYGTGAFRPEPKGFANRLVTDAPAPSQAPGRAATHLPRKIRAALRERALMLARRVVFREPRSPAAS
jgi:peptidoglycan/xylan/chitin deacetylase (PgdA/CDA1 family)